MLAVGVDMIEVARIERGLARFGQRFADRFFTPAEQLICAGDARRLAGRFAVKEAVGKALGTGIGDIRWVDVEIVHDARGRPELVLHDSAKRLADGLNLDNWSISLSHTDEYAIGFVVGMSVRGDNRGAEEAERKGAHE